MALKEITIQELSRQTKESSYNDSTYEMVFVTDPTGQRYTAFDNPKKLWTTEWKEGDVIEVNVKQVDKDGKTYFNLEQVTPDNCMALIKDLRQRVTILEGGKSEAADGKEGDGLPF